MSSKKRHITKEEYEKLIAVAKNGAAIGKIMAAKYKENAETEEAKRNLRQGNRNL